MKDEDIKCPVPWYHLSIGSRQNLRLCYACNENAQHIYEGNSKLEFNSKQEIKELMNNELFKNIRLTMLNGEWHESCLYCKKLEELGSVSPRIYSKRNLEHQGHKLDFLTSQDGSIELDIKSCHISLSTLCNLQCRMCDPYYSSGLIKAWSDLNIKFDKEAAVELTTNFKTEDHIERLTEIIQQVTDFSILGGETFINPEYEKLLQLAIDLGVSKNIVIHSSTNGTTLPSKLPQLWKHFKGIIIYVSLEGVKDFNDYIRYPSHWSIIEKNLLKLKKLSKIMPLKFQIHTVFQAYTILKLHDTMEYLTQILGKQYSVPHVLYLDDKPSLQADILPIELQQLAEKRIVQFLKRSNLIATENAQALLANIQLMKTRTNPCSLDDFFSIVTRFDRRNNGHIWHHIPELTKYYKQFILRVKNK